MDQNQQRRETVGGPIGETRAENSRRQNSSRMEAFRRDEKAKEEDALRIVPQSGLPPTEA